MCGVELDSRFSTYQIAILSSIVILRFRSISIFSCTLLEIAAAPSNSDSWKDPCLVVIMLVWVGQTTNVLVVASRCPGSWTNPLFNLLSHVDHRAVSMRNVISTGPHVCSCRCSEQRKNEMDHFCFPLSTHQRCTGCVNRPNIERMSEEY